jgi:trehalose-6-phosphate synthase
LKAALVMPRIERLERHQRMLAVLRQNDIHAWHARAVGSLRGGYAPVRDWNPGVGPIAPARSRSPLRPPS